MIDWERIDALRSEVGAEDFDEVVDLFLEEVGEVIARLGAAPQPERYEDDLHFLRGGALNLGFTALADLCDEGERMAASGHAAGVDIGAVIALYAASRRAFLQGAGRGAPHRRRIRSGTRPASRHS